MRLERPPHRTIAASAIATLYRCAACYGWRVASRGQPIQIVRYDPGWPALFEEERRSLERVFRGVPVVIEHVGSTSVPGLGGKPIVDIMLGPERLRDVEDRIRQIEQLGYGYVPEYEDHLPERRYFRKPRTPPRRFHLHAVERTSDFWERHLLFRDYLRVHPDVARKYYELKRELAERHRFDQIDSYTEAKSDFIEAALDRARRVRRL